MIKNTHRPILLLSVFLFLASFLKAEEAKPSVTGMYFYASWCSACKTLEPKLSEATSAVDSSNFELVKFDVSNKPKQHQSKLHAAKLNLESKYDEIGVKTGFVVLVETATGKEISRIKRSDSVEKINKRIEAAVAKVDEKG